jgi:protein-tyrosine-phosphatase
MSEPVPDTTSPHIVFVCTGNAARSVMAGAILAAHVDDAEVEQLAITTAGTHVVEGMPMSWRTREALAGIDVSAPGHRSTQLRDEHVDAADLVVGLAREHVEYVRRTHPDAAAKTATLRRLARDLAVGPEPLPERVAALGLASATLEAWEDVVDPGGGELSEFEACAQQIRDLIADLAPALRGS